MFTRKLVWVWLAIIIFSAAFLLGQETWSPPECVDIDEDGYGVSGFVSCPHPEFDCDDSDPAINPGASEGPAGDASCTDEIDNDCNDQTDNAEEPKCNPDDLNMTDADFECILNWTKVATYYITNKRGYEAEALSVAASPTGGTFPPGTIIQLFPSEAMVKRAPGWNPVTNDWEFFFLVVDDTGTQIWTRGAEETKNRFGGNCFDCHRKAEPQWDLICQENHGCDPLPDFVSDAFIEALQQADPRCS